MKGQADATPAKATPRATPAAGKPGRPPEYKVRPREEHLSPLPIVAGILLVVVGTVYAFFSGRNSPDPHLVRARQIVTRYEQVRDDGSRDYESQPYDDALAELGLVKRGTRWAKEADDMAADIQGKRAAQQSRVRARNAEMQARQEARQRRDEEFFRTTRMKPPNPEITPDDPACEEPSARGHSGHEH